MANLPDLCQTQSLFQVFQVGGPSGKRTDGGYEVTFNQAFDCRVRLVRQKEVM